MIKISNIFNTNINTNTEAGRWFAVDGEKGDIGLRSFEDIIEF